MRPSRRPDGKGPRGGSKGGPLMGLAGRWEPMSSERMRKIFSMVAPGTPLREGPVPAAWWWLATFLRCWP